MVAEPRVEGPMFEQEVTRNLGNGFWAKEPAMRATQS